MFFSTSVFRSVSSLNAPQLENAGGIGLRSIQPLLANMKKSVHAPYFRSMLDGSKAGIGTADCAPSGPAISARAKRATSERRIDIGGLKETPPICARALAARERGSASTPGASDLAPHAPQHRAAVGHQRRHGAPWERPAKRAQWMGKPLGDASLVHEEAAVAQHARHFTQRRPTSFHRVARVVA